MLIGPTGVGKSGVAIGLLREACLNGYRGCFYNAQELLDELYASLADRSSSKLITRLSRMCPLVVDEIGYVTVKPEQANAFFRLMEQRYNRVSTILTTNLDFRTGTDCSRTKTSPMRCWIACNITASPSASTVRHYSIRTSPVLNRLFRQQSPRVANAPHVHPPRSA